MENSLGKEHLKVSDREGKTSSDRRTRSEFQGKKKAKWKEDEIMKVSRKNRKGRVRNKFNLLSFFFGMIYVTFPVYIFLKYHIVLKRATCVVNE